MKQLIAHRYLYIFIALVVIGFVVSLLLRAGNGNEALVTDTVSRGHVEQLVSVSGVAKADQTAELAFPTGGIVASVLVEEGQAVVAGEALIMLDMRALQADRQDAAAALARAVAQRDELIAGPSDTARAATSEQVELASNALATTKTNQARLIENARRTLLSSDLAAKSTDSSEDATPPTITGTYTCDTEGTYTLRVFSSSADSGYSYNLSGLEFDTETAFVDQSSPLGSCGLRIQFDDGGRYNNSVWEIEIPNPAGASYVTNQNAYELAKTNAASAIAIAEQDLAVAAANETNTNAPARQEAVTRANADITAAQARLARIDAQLADRTLTAPFAGTISRLDILPGETVGTSPVVTLVGDSTFELTARIPEIDIAQVVVGQSARVRFDAYTSQTYDATVTRIAIEATEIDGVGYYETTLVLTDEPEWLRNGLNADVDIIVASTRDSSGRSPIDPTIPAGSATSGGSTSETQHLRIPRRFLIETEPGYAVIVFRNGDWATTTVGVHLIGNDGYVAIKPGDIQFGDTLLAP